MRTFPALRAFIAALPILFGVGGMALAFYPTLFSGFAQIQQDPARQAEPCREGSFPSTSLPFGPCMRAMARSCGAVAAPRAGYLS